VKPPAEWATSEGRKAIEKIHPCSHLTMYVKVRITFGMGIGVYRLFYSRNFIRVASGFG
jgi:hypothetical protein